MSAMLQNPAPSDLRSGTAWYKAVTSPRPTNETKRTQTKLCIFMLATVGGLNLYAPAHPGCYLRLLGSLLLILGAVPVWLWNSGRDKRMPVLPFIAFFFCLYYGLPVFVMKRYSISWYAVSTIPESLIEPALVASCTGITAILIGYYFPLPRRLTYLLPQIDLRWTDASTLQRVGLFLATFGCGVYYAGFALVGSGALDSVAPSLGQAFFFLTETATVGIAILYLLQEVGCLKPFYRVYLWAILIPSRVLMGLATGAVYQAMSIVLLLVFIRSSLRRQIPWSILVAGFAVFMILQPTKTLFREASQNQMSATGESLLRRAELFASIAWKVVTGETDQNFDIVQVGMDRLNYLPTLAKTLELTPAVVPFWNGETYRLIWFKFIPRFVYPTKPEENFGQAFGHRYGLLNPDDNLTSYNLSQLVEAYANFGSLGAIIIMFVTGLFYRVGHDIFVHPSMGMGAFVAAAYIISRWFNIESNTSLVLGGLPVAVAFVFCLHSTIRLLERRLFNESVMA